MKTKIIYKTNSGATLKRVTVAASVCLFFFLLTSQGAFSQSLLGVGVDRYLTGNGLGTFYSPYISLNAGNHTIYGGPVIQKRSMTIGGAKLGYSRVITGNEANGLDDEGDNIDSRLQLNFFAYAQYVNDLPLSYRSQIIEERCNLKMDYNWNDLRLTTAEICAGIELHIKITKYISWKNYFGATVYNHLNYKEGMYHDKIRPVLLLGTGIHVTPFKK